jgi:hypothetical protein
MTQFEQACIAAAKAFLAGYSQVTQTVGQTLQQQSPPPGFSSPAEELYLEPTATSNGVPVCPLHKKPATQGQYGWYCKSKATDPAYTNQKGYCNIKEKI